MTLRPPLRGRLPTAAEALPGRSGAVEPGGPHPVLNHPLTPPWPEGLEEALFGMGCFWGAERLFWQVQGIWTTVVGYAGGHTPNPSYEEVCSGWTGHAEVVRVVFDPQRLSYGRLLRLFWESHDPTQGFRQGNDVGSQYRSLTGFHGARQERLARESAHAYGARLRSRGYGEITTEILPAPRFYAAEPRHQQYLWKNPAGYCGLRGSGVSCPRVVGEDGG